MRRNSLTIMLMLIMLFQVSFRLLAGDIPEGIMLGNQEALFIGQINDMTAEYYDIIPITIMMGAVGDEEIQIKKFEQYYGTEDKPQEGDYIVAVLLDEQQVDNSWIFKTTSSDYKTLELVSAKYNMVERYEEYINNGAYFEAQKKIDFTQNQTLSQEVIQIEDTQDERKGYITYVVMGIILTVTTLGIVSLISYKKRCK